jgi:amino-acid N-acetyltransferase
MPIEIRPATADDQESIVALVRSERLNPTGLHWQKFVVAEDAGRIVGAAQIRKYKDGSRELASLVVEPSWREQGLATRMIETLLASEPGRLFVITSERRSAYLRAGGFRRQIAVVPRGQSGSTTTWASLEAGWCPCF